jgi:hypothetical protein
MEVQGKPPHSLNITPLYFFMRCYANSLNYLKKLIRHEIITTDADSLLRTWYELEDYWTLPVLPRVTTLRLLN